MGAETRNDRSAFGAGAPVVAKEPVFHRADYLLYLPLTALLLGANAAFLYYWFSLELGAVAGIVSLLLLYGIGVQLFSWFLLPLMRRPRPLPPQPGWKVGVATSFVPGAESLEMLEQTLRALVAMEYPHETWLLDEGDDAEAKALCQRLGVLHFSRRPLPQYQAESGPFQAGSKVGNYNAWLHEIAFERYEIIVGFDPDHVPEANYLVETIGYFADPGIGYVQAPQVYYNEEASFIARGAAEETYTFYSAGQMGSYAGGYPIVTGSHHIHRATALKEVGGFPAHDAEDVLITLLYRAHGWQGVYVPKVLARGLTPVDWPSYLQQQLRWARSVLDIKLRHFPRVARHLPLKERLLGFLHGFHYLQSLWMCVAVLLVSYLLVTGVQPQFFSFTTALYLLGLAVAHLPAHFFVQRFYLDPARQGGLHLRSRLLRAAKWPYFLLALRDALRGRKVSYILTPKVKTGEKQYMLLRPHLTVALVVATAWGFGMLQGHDLHPLLHLAAAVTVLLSLGLVWTETWDYPEPYDPALWQSGKDAVHSQTERSTPAGDLPPGELGRLRSDASVATVG